MSQLELQLIEAIKKDMLFDFIATHGHEFGKPQLIRLAMELSYGMYRLERNGIITSGEYAEARTGVVSELTEIWGE